MLFEAHQMMLDDLDFVESIEGMIENDRVNAEAAVSDTGAQFAEMFAAMDDSYMQARAADIRDISAPGDRHSDRRRRKRHRVRCAVYRGGR